MTKPIDEHYRRLPIQPNTVQIPVLQGHVDNKTDVPLSAVHWMNVALKYLLRAGYKPGNPWKQEFEKAINCLQNAVQAEPGKPGKYTVEPLDPFPADGIFCRIGIDEYDEFNAWFVANVRSRTYWHFFLEDAASYKCEVYQGGEHGGHNAVSKDVFVATVLKHFGKEPTSKPCESVSEFEARWQASKAAPFQFGAKSSCKTCVHCAVAKNEDHWYCDHPRRKSADFNIDVCWEGKE